MKKTLRMLAAMLMAFCLFAGCAGGEQTADNGGQEQNQTISARGLNEIYDDILNLGILPEMYILEDAYIEGYYGIAPEDISEKVFAIADDSLLADTVIMLRVSESGDAAAIAERFRTVNNQRLAEMESYNPTQYERASKAVIEVDGNCVYYIITDDNAAVTELLG